MTTTGGDITGGGEPRYAELHAHTNFSFLDGASHPEELAAHHRRDVTFRSLPPDLVASLLIHAAASQLETQASSASISFWRSNFPT